MTPEIVTEDVLRQMRADHSGDPQCQFCMQPQRCTIGWLLDVIDARATVIEAARTYSTLEREWVRDRYSMATAKAVDEADSALRRAIEALDTEAERHG